MADSRTSTRSPPDGHALLREGAGHRHDRVFEPHREQYWQVISEAFTGAPAAIVTLPTDLLAEWFGADATWLVENFRFNNVFDCRAAECDLGFRPRISLRDGMRQTADDYGTEWIKAGGSDKEAAFDCRYEKAIGWRQKFRPQGYRS